MKELKTSLWGNIPIFENDPFSDRKSNTKIIKGDADERTVQVRVLEKQKSFTWMRLYVNDPIENLSKGDTIRMTYTETGEYLDVTFASYEKSKLHKDDDSETVTEYSDKEDQKILCLMVDIDEVNVHTSIPFIRTLFKGGRFYEYQLLRISDLDFTLLKDDNKYPIKYFSVTF